jgi:hypothetical protein
MPFFMTIFDRFELKTLHILVLSIVFAFINLTIHWPGNLTPDSKGQLLEAYAGNYSDWHPPIMALIWRQLLFFGYSLEPMLVFQISFHWLGLGLFSYSICKAKYPISALLMLISGFTPIALKYTGVIQKDTLLTSLMIAGFGLTSLDNLKLKWFGILIGFIAMLSRANAVFAFTPLLIFSFQKWLKSQNLYKFFLTCVFFSILLIPVSQWINHSIFNAKRTNVERSLQLYDLAGIAYFSGDKSVLPVNIENIKNCYTPLFWDTLTSERCGGAFAKIDRDITRDWLNSIFNHPSAYFKHRLSHFNREIFFLVPPAQQCVDAPEFHNCPKSFLSDAIHKNGLLWPVAWLTLGITMLLTGIKGIAQALCLSGVLYGLGYLFFGVAADFRYFYWTELAIQTALIYQLAFFGFAKWRIAALAVITVWIIGYSYRILNYFETTNNYETVQAFTLILQKINLI